LLIWKTFYAVNSDLTIGAQRWYLVLISKKQILIWISALRLQFLLAAPIPQVFIGASVAWYFKGIFDPLLFILAMLGSTLAYLGCFGINEYFDYKSKADVFAQKFKTPFSGGSGTLPLGLLKPTKVYRYSIVILGLGTLIAAYLTFSVGPMLILFAIIAITGACFYTAPPLRLSYKGMGEFLTGIYCGPIVVLGTYYVLTKEFAFEPILSAVPVGIFVTAILWINEIPDYLSDKQAGKRTLIVKLGKKYAVRIYPLLLMVAYILLILNAVSKIAPLSSCFTLMTLPLAIKNITIVNKYYKNPKKLIPAMGGQIKLHIIVGAILAVSYFITPL
jgi:1,4-dihydroxy-2-naphthoate octaprenyltransferase